jgi:hypothetical protein
MGTVSPKVEGRLLFNDTVAPVITTNSPVSAQSYLHPDYITLDFSALEGLGGTTPSLAAPSGVSSLTAALDGKAVVNGQKIDLNTLALGNHKLIIIATDYFGNKSTQEVPFSIFATVQSLRTSVNRRYSEKAINDASVRDSLLSKLNEAQMYLDKGNKKAAINSLNAFLNLVKAQNGKHITKAAAALLTADAQYVIAHPK